MKEQLVGSHAKRVRAIESGDLTMLGVNAGIEADAVTARRRRRHPRRQGHERTTGRADRAARAVPREARQRRRHQGARRASEDRSGGRQRHAVVDRRGESGRHDGRVGRRAARRVRRVPGPHGRHRSFVGWDRSGTRRASARDASPPSRNSSGSDGSGSSSASRASTATATPPSRSRCAPETSGWRLSIQGSDSPRRRSHRWQPTRTSTSSVCRSCPARTIC